jgi:hypothetical protein
MNCRAQLHTILPAAKATIPIARGIALLQHKAGTSSDSSVSKRDLIGKDQTFFTSAACDKVQLLMTMN